MIRRPPRSTPLYSSAASDVYKRQVTGVVVVDLVFELIAGNRDLLGVDNYDVITAVEVRCVLRLVLAHEAGSNLGSQAAKGLAFGVDNVPIVRKFGWLG